MKKLLTGMVLSLVVAGCTPTGSMQGGMSEGMQCKCCQEMMKEGCKCCEGMSGDTKKEGSGCCCKGMMSGSGMDMKDGKGMMCEKMMQNTTETKKPAAKSKIAPPSEHEQHH